MFSSLIDFGDYDAARRRFFADAFAAFALSFRFTIAPLTADMPHCR